MNARDYDPDRAFNTFGVMGLSVTKECGLCEGKGDVGIFDQHGSHRYDVRCPECWGAGEVEDEEAEAEELARYDERLEAAWSIIRQNARAKGEA